MSPVSLATICLRAGESAHPDRGGDTRAMQELNRAREAALAARNTERAMRRSTKEIDNG